MNSYSTIKELLGDTFQDVLPTAVSATINASLQDQRVGMIAGGLSLAAAGVTSIQVSEVPQTIRSWFAPTPSSPEENQASKKQGYRWGLAIAGLAGTCLGVAAIGLGVFQLIASPVSHETEQVRYPFSNPLESDDSESSNLNLSFNCLEAAPVSPNPDSLVTNEGGCLFGPTESKYNYPCEPGSHTINSPIFGARNEEVKLLQKLQQENPKNYQILDDLQEALYYGDAIGADFRNMILNPGPNERGHQDVSSLKIEANQLAGQMYSNFLNKYRPYGIDESNAIELLSQRDCYKYDVEGGGIRFRFNEENPHFLKALVCKGGLDESYFFLPEGVVAIHELMHLEEMSRNEGPMFGLELFTVTRDLINLDSIYKKIHQIPLGQEVDYEKYVPIIHRIFHRCDEFRIPLGRLINFYRNLEETKGSLGAALTSKESIDFLAHCTPES